MQGVVHLSSAQTVQLISYNERCPLECTRCNLNWNADLSNSDRDIENTARLSIESGIQMKSLDKRVQAKKNFGFWMKSISIHNKNITLCLILVCHGFLSVFTLRQFTQSSLPNPDLWSSIITLFSPFPFQVLTSFKFPSGWLHKQNLNFGFPMWTQSLTKAHEKKKKIKQFFF